MFHRVAQWSAPVFLLCSSVWAFGADVSSADSSTVDTQNSMTEVAEVSASDEVIVVTSGDWQQGAVLTGTLAPGFQARFMDRDLTLSDKREFVIGLGRDFPKTATLELTDANGKKTERHFSVVQREYKIQRIEGVPNKTVNPDPEQVKRSRKEGAMAWRARMQTIERNDFLNSFEWPLTGPITGVYGSQRYYNGQPRRPHFGVDVARPTGTVVVAPNSGVVTLVHPDMFFSGGTLIVDHGLGLSSSFIHLSKILVKEGDVVELGQPIAEVGATGRVTGPHLDWRMNWFDQRVDPQLLVGPMPKTP